MKIIWRCREGPDQEGGDRKRWECKEVILVGKHSAITLLLGKKSVNTKLIEVIKIDVVWNWSNVQLVYYARTVNHL